MNDVIMFNVNNGGTLALQQSDTDKPVKVFSSNDESFEIDPGEFVMLLNYYRHIKRNNLHCDFINPDGKKRTFYTVTIVDYLAKYYCPCTAVFDDDKYTNDFLFEAVSNIEEHHACDHVFVSKDLRELNEKLDLDLIAECYAQ